MIEYVSLRAALDPVYIPRSIRRMSDDNTLLSYMLTGYKLLNVSQKYEEKYKIFELKNHSIGTLPDEINTINLVTYIVSQVDVNNLKVEDYELKPLRYVGNRTINMSLLDYNNSSCKVCYHPELSSCSETYSISTFKELTTSVKEGYVCIDYLAEPVDENGDFLIINDPNVLNFLGNYAITMLWRERANSLEQGTMVMFQTYLGMTETLLKKAKGSLIQRQGDLSLIDSITGTNTFNQRLMRSPSFIFSKKDN